MGKQSVVTPENKSSISTVSSGILQRKCDCGKGAGLSGKCEDCGEKPLTLKRKAMGSGQEKSAPLPLHDFLRPRQGKMPLLQPKLKIGAPNDKYEKEADRVAEQVMRMPESQMQTDLEDNEEEKIQTKPISSQITPLVQRYIEPEEEDEEDMIQLNQLENQKAALVQREMALEDDEEEVVQLKKMPGQAMFATPDIANRVQNLEGGGQPLSKDTRNFFETRFDYDFSNVRVHTDSESTRGLSARAYTIGKDVVFNSGLYQPGTNEGKQLLAHELTHVIQQQNSRQFFDKAKKIQRQTLELPSFDPRLFIEGDKKSSLIYLDIAELIELYTTNEASLEFKFPAPFYRPPSLLQEQKLYFQTLSFTKDWITGDGKKYIENEIKGDLNAIEKKNDISKISSIFLKSREIKGDPTRKEWVINLLVSTLEKVEAKIFTQKKFSRENFEAQLKMLKNDVLSSANKFNPKSKTGLGKQGHVPEKVRLKAKENLDNFREFLQDTEMNLLWASQKLENAKDFNAENFFDGESVLMILYEALDGVGIAVPENLEAKVTILAKLAKLIIMLSVKYDKAKKKNKQLEEDIETKNEMQNTFNTAKQIIDELANLIKIYPRLAFDLAVLNIQEPNKISKIYAGQIELRILKENLLKKKGAKLVLRTTKQLNINSEKIKYYQTKHYKKAVFRHKDPTDNWFLSPNTPDIDPLPFHPTADYACSWKVLIIEEVPEKAVEYVLSRMNSYEIPKKELFNLRGTSLPLERKPSGLLYQVDVFP